MTVRTFAAGNGRPHECSAATCGVEDLVRDEWTRFSSGDTALVLRITTQ